MNKILFILYVSNQDISTEFYSKILGQQPVLHVPGMTEYALRDGGSLGLMPAHDIKELFGDRLPDPSRAQGIPRGEVYFIVKDAESYHQRALAHGATEISGMAKRPWGDHVAYSLDPDGHVLAFCEYQGGAG